MIEGRVRSYIYSPNTKKNVLPCNPCAIGHCCRDSTLLCTFHRLFQCDANHGVHVLTRCKEPMESRCIRFTALHQIFTQKSGLHDHSSSKFIRITPGEKMHTLKQGANIRTHNESFCLAQKNNQQEKWTSHKKFRVSVKGSWQDSASQTTAPDKWYRVQMKTHLHQLVAVGNTTDSHLLPSIHPGYLGQLRKPERRNAERK